MPLHSHLSMGKVLARGSTLTLLVFVTFFQAKAQNLPYVKHVVDTLCAESYHGRGYYGGGGLKAANFIAQQFAAAGLQPISSQGYFQNFSHPVNTFPDKLLVKIDGKELKPGVDYLVDPASGGSPRKTFQLVILNLKDFKSVKALNKKVKKVNLNESALVYDRKLVNENASDEVKKALSTNQLGAGAIIELVGEKLTWSVAGTNVNYVHLEFLNASFNSDSKTIEVEIDQKLIPQFSNQNVVGMVKADIETDSFIVFTAHYDHLGRMGNQACFYGANDNASGTATMMDLARYYVENRSQQRYNMVFIAFGAEEAGLIGSHYFVDHPMVSLSHISLLVNLDLLSTGKDGMMVVNGKVYKKVLHLLQKTNEQCRCMAEIKSRGKAANSDHYWFSEKGVKAVFIYLLGTYPHYHDIFDTPEKPDWAGYEGFFHLITKSVAQWPVPIE